ncbi:RNA polymerase sigma factor [Alkaliphilus hydrothermalis]|uniref:RNA polymerase sigma-70 factor (ECF subfamily) n=1 Tax=Alkaliphilus hydrothermalis TaxID=1482730 RepID=A0ABS2NR35_9FIRM|nr:sigma-70 family RNA polymerase sigma factor [Alkaliphilus hydrothermalis]MBM7615423.1 RNA polymerase sigma-70 factor (ECF subfamily) [Alkaliphilus hydrothermalis]
MMSDWEIIQLIVQGNSELFRELVGRYKKAVYSLCYRMLKNHEEAEDLSQEAFIKTYNYLGKYDPSYKFSTWILKIATNTTIDYLRKKKVETLPLEEEIATKQEGASAEAVYFHHHNKDLIQEAINQLPADYRTLIVLYHQYGLSYKEIADSVNLPMTKVKNRLHRGRSLLKEKLINIKEEGAQWTAKQVQL